MAKDSIIIITGASGSIGRIVCREIARWTVGRAASASMEKEKDISPEIIVMACRNLEKGAKVKAQLEAECPGARFRLEQLELSDIESIKSFARRLQGSRISHIFHNAGVISRGRIATHSGYENTLMVNYLGPVILNEFLSQGIDKSRTRIVNMVSLTCCYGRIRDDFFHARKFSRLGTYSDTKLALLIYSKALADAGWNVNVSDPGIVDSNMIAMGKWFDPLADKLFRPFCKSPEQGAHPAVNALRSRKSGLYFVGAVSRPMAGKVDRRGRSSIYGARLSDAHAEFLLRETRRILRDTLGLDLTLLTT